MPTPGLSNPIVNHTACLENRLHVGSTGRNCLRWKSIAVTIAAAYLATACAAWGQASETPAGTDGVREDTATIKAAATSALRQAESEFGKGDVRTLQAMNRLASVCLTQGTLDQAESLCERLLVLCTETVKPEDPAAIHIVSTLASLRTAQKRHADAGRLYDRLRTLREQRAALPPEPPKKTSGHAQEPAAATGDPIKDWLAAIDSPREDSPPTSPLALEMGKALGTLATSLEKRDSYWDAIQLYRSLEDLQRNTLGRDDLDRAVTAARLANAYNVVGENSSADSCKYTALSTCAGALRDAMRWGADPAEAEKTIKRVAAIQEVLLGPGAPEVASTWSTLARMYLRQGKDAEAEALYKRCMATWDAGPDADDADLALGLRDLAELYERQGRLVEACAAHERIVGILKKRYGPDDRLVVSAMTDLAVLYRNSAWYDKEELLRKHILAVRKQNAGKNRPALAIAMDALGSVYRAQGRYAEAEPLHRRAIEILEETPGHRHTTEVMANLASLCEVQYKMGEAEALYKQALQMRQENLKPDDPRIAAALDNLAVFYSSQGQFERAETMHRRALDIMEKAQGPDSVAVASSATGLANSLLWQAKYAEAEALLTRALALFEKGLGSKSGAVALSLGNVAIVDYLQGRHAEAIRALERSETIQLEVLGEDHPGMRLVWDNMAGVKIAMGEDQAALDLMLRARALEERTVREVFAFSSENERLDYLERLADGTDLLLSQCAHKMPASEAATRGALDHLLRRKGIVLDSLLEDAEAARLSGDPAVKTVLDELRTVRAQLSRLIVEGPAARSAEVYQAEIRGTRTRAAALEKDLARLSARFEQGRRMWHVGLDQVAAALPEGHVLVEFARYRHFDFQARGAEPCWGNGRYIAYVLRGGEDSPQLVHLGEAEALDRAIRVYRSQLAAFAAGRGDVARLETTGEALSSMLWAPLEPALENTGRIYLSPDGELNFVSFAGLRDKTGRYVVENYDLSYVASGRDLLRGHFAPDTSGRSSALFGAPAFGDTQDNPPPANTAIDPTLEMLPRAGVFRGELTTVRSFGGMTFPPLPGTLVEVRAIAAMLADNGLKSQTHVGTASTEKQVKATKQPRFLHLATHGFFLPEDRSGRQPEKQGILGLTRGGTGLGSQPRHRDGWRLANPMHRSGLALAGANLTLAGQTRPGDEDGILTAEEVASLDLVGTEMVVLSACETGLGEARGGEGVLGLRRAIVQAGARDLVLTLWRVPDAETAALMEDLYSRHLSGEPLWRALLQCQRAALAAQRKAGRRPNPYPWASFVLSGIGMPTSESNTAIRQPGTRE